MFGSQSVTTGAAYDIQKATAWAAQYVRHWGFGKYLSRTDVTDSSEENINTNIDPTNPEIESILQQQNERAQKLLQDHHGAFVRIIQTLEADGMVQPIQLANWLHLPIEEGGEVVEPYAKKLHDFVQRKGQIWHELPLKAA